MKRFVLFTFFVCCVSFGFTQVSCPSVMKDFEGNTYKTVIIGRQCWCATNMRTTKDRNGENILYGEDMGFSDYEKNDKIPYLYSPDGRIDIVNQYGYLYNFYAAVKICPQGWHLPSDHEWSLLLTYLSTHSTFCCNDRSTFIAKSLSSTTDWECNHGGWCTVCDTSMVNNTTGFCALPAGCIICDWAFGDRFHDDKDRVFSYSKDFSNSYGKTAFFWSSTPLDHGECSYAIGLYCERSEVLRGNACYCNGLSVRCIHD